MNRIKSKYYSIVDFPMVEDQTLRLSLGILGYLFLTRRSKHNISYVPVRFIQPLNTKCTGVLKSKVDLTSILIKHGYLRQYQRPNKKRDSDDDITIITKRGKRITLGDIKRGYKNIPYLYIPLDKLYKLKQIILKDEKTTKWIDEHLHLLNNTQFNHYNHSYKYINIDIPRLERLNINEDDLRVLDTMRGRKDIKEYDISDYGRDTSTGIHVNAFTYNKQLIRYTNIEDPFEIGLKDCRYLIIADQLYKTFGNNDLSAYYFRNKKATIKPPKIEKGVRYKWIRGEDGQILWDDKGIWRREAVIKATPKSKKKYLSIVETVPLFESLLENTGISFVPASEPFKQNDPYGYDLTEEIFFQKLDSAIFGWKFIKEFRELFPTTNELLYKVKRGVYFEKFCGGLKYTIFRSDFRLQLEKDHPAFKRGQIYYVLISLVRYMRTAEIMNDVFKRLKKCGVQFIPLRESVAVAGEKKNLTEYIFNDVCRNHISKELHYEIFIRDLKEEAVPIENIQGLTVEEIYQPRLNDGDNVPLF